MGRRSSWFVLLVCLGLFGCEACGSHTSTDPGASEPVPPSDPPPSDPPPSTAPADPPSDPPPSDPPPTAPPPPPSEPAPALSLTTRWDGARATVVLANESGAAVQFSSRLLLERRDGEAWRDAARGSFVAQLDAEHALPECAELVSGASLELVFPAASGTGGPSAPPEGVHRFVVTSCGGAGRLEGPPFTTP
ncbi:MAG: hypothetical protein U0353_15550 [Sandaracinus sp.]